MRVEHFTIEWIIGYSVTDWLAGHWSWLLGNQHEKQECVVGYLWRRRQVTIAAKDKKYRVVQMELILINI